MGGAFDFLKQYLTDDYGATPETVISEASFVEDLNMDSLDLVELVMRIEEEFGVALTEQEAESISTVSQAVHLLEEKGVGT